MHAWLNTSRLGSLLQNKNEIWNFKEAEQLEEGVVLVGKPTHTQHVFVRVPTYRRAFVPVGGCKPVCAFGHVRAHARPCVWASMSSGSLSAFLFAAWNTSTL